MDAYLFQAALICEDCCNEFKKRNVKPADVDETDEGTYDSDQWPKGPYSDGGGEADCPQHCDHCGLFLENPLTPDGDAYVREKANAYVHDDASWSEVAEKAERAGELVLAEWIIFYFAWGR